MSQQTEILPPQQNIIDVDALIRQVLRNFWLIILFGAMFGFLGLIYALRPIPYEVHSTINIEPVSIDGILSTASINLDTEIGRIRSWTTVERVIEDMNRYGFVTLRNSPEMMSKWQKAIYFFRTGKKQKELAEFSVKVEQLKFPAVLDGHTVSLHILGDNRYSVINNNDLELFTGTVGDVQDKSGSYTLEISEINAPKGSVFAVQTFSKEAMIEKSITSLKVVKRASTQKSSLLDVRYYAKEPYYALKFSEAMVNDYISGAYNRISSNKNRAIVEMQKELAAAEAKLVESEIALGDYMQKIDVADIESEIRGQLELRLSLEQALRQVQMQKAQLKHVYTKGHPAMKASADKEAQLKARLGLIKKQLGSLPGIKGKLFTLNSKIRQETTKYESILKQYSLFKSDASALPNYASIVNFPRIARHNLRNKSIQVVVLAAMMGGIIALSFIILSSNVLNFHLKRAEQIIGEHGISIYDLDSPKGEGVEDVMEEVVAQFSYIANQKKNNITAITANIATSRKTELTIEMAKRFASKKGKTLLIDANVKESSLAEELGLKNEEGFANAMVGKMPSNEVIQKVEGNLYFMSSGNPKMSVQILRDFERFEYLLREFGKLFDRIIIDLPAQRDLPFWQSLITRTGTVVHFYEKGGHIDLAGKYINTLESLSVAQPKTLHEVLLYTPKNTKGGSLFGMLFNRA